jgi:5-methylcytosine-specific restriction endonuclease McrA
MADDSQSRISSERKIVSLAEARERGLSKYFTGEPCKRGHVSERITKDRQCCECKSINCKAWWSRNKDQVAPKNKAWKVRNPDRCRAHSRTAYHKDVEASRATLRKRAKDNPEKFRRFARASYRKHRDKRIETVRKYYENNRDRCMASTHRWNEKNPENRRSISRKWARTHIEKILSWQAKHPEKIRIYAKIAKAQRRARERLAEGTFTESDISRIYKQQRGLCTYCRTSLKGKYHVDHITALAAGGSNWPSNLQLCCPTCNHQKNAMDPIEFAQSIGRLI